MKTNEISLQKMAYFSILVFSFVYVLIVGQGILAPLAFGALFAFILKPVCDFYESKIKWKIPAIFLGMLSATIPVLLLIYLFSAQVIEVFQDLPSIQEKVSTGISAINAGIKDVFGFTQAETDQFLKEQAPKILGTPLSELGGGLSSSTSVLIDLFIISIYVFLFLLYRSAIKNFILIQGGKDDRENTMGLLSSVQTLIQKYIYGLLLVILIMGTLNSLGLWALGIKYALFWGFFAASLAIIPYLGTFIGGLLPFLFTLATFEYAWQPFGVIVLFITVQTIEGNLITPKIVGSSVNINPLAAIIALLVGSQIWGIAGMILSMPAVAVFKELLKQSDHWKPVGFLLSDQLTEEENVFVRRWDNEKFRLRNFFRVKK